MKTLFRFPLLAVAASLLFIGATVKAQNTPASTPRYKDVVVDNPNAERDMKVVGDFVNALTVSGDFDKVRSLAATNFMGHGPAATDSANIDQTIKNFQEGQKTQLNRKIGFVSQTFRVKSGNLKGDWVSLWGTYTFTDAPSAKTVSFPFQYTARVFDGKLASDIVYYDRLYILTQLGFNVIPPDVAKK